MTESIETIKERNDATDDAFINEATLLDIFVRLQRVKLTDSFTRDDQLMVSPHIVLRLVYEVLRSRSIVPPT